jgi:RNA 2',3'-cyclic 3'-phosphodiesterase
MKRLFLAVDLSIASVEQFALFRESVAEEMPGLDIRWVDSPDLHLTLRYWGRTEEHLVPMLAECIRGMVRSLFPFELKCRGVGCFPSDDSPRILWSGLDDRASEVMGLLVQTLQKEIGQHGWQPETRSYLPQITLGRFRNEVPDLQAFLSAHENRDFGKTYVRDFILFESVVGRMGPRFDVVDRFVLGDQR